MRTELTYVLEAFPRQVRDTNGRNEGERDRENVLAIAQEVLESI